VHKRQIYHIAESNQIEKNRFGSENRIESKLFSPELECSNALSCGVVCVILIASRGKKRVHSVVNICYKYAQQVAAARMVGDTTTCSRQNHHRPVGLCVCVSAEFSEKNSRYDPTRRSRARADSSLSRRRLACCLSSSVNQSINRRRRRRDRSAARNLHVSTPVVQLSPSPSPDICPPRTSAPPSLPGKLPSRTSASLLGFLLAVTVPGA